MADTNDVITGRQAFVNDPRIACKYGAKCYQKNPVHQQKYKHPPPKVSYYEWFSSPQTMTQV